MVLVGRQHGDLRSQLSRQNRLAAGSLLLAMMAIMAVFVAFRFTCPRRFAPLLLCHYGIFMALSLGCELIPP